MANTAPAVMNRAIGEIGYSRWDDPEPGTKYGRWYAALVGDSQYGASGVPFCAMGASWSFYLEDAICAGLPGAYCPTMLNAGRNAGKAVGNRDGKYGDVIYFDWNGDRLADHVGLVEGNTGNYYQTVEFNTGDGQVLRRTRDYGTVIGVVRPSYGAATEAPPAGSDIDDLARRVINGEFGNGDARRAALGDKYDAVQQRVNQMLQGDTSPAPTTPSVDTAVPAGTYQIVVDGLNVRTAATTASTVVACYSYGETVILDGWSMENGGWIWGRYIGASSGAYRYIAVREISGKEYARKVG